MVSRPTTPLRPSSRSSLRDSASRSTGGEASFPLNAFEPAFAELSDAMADLEANMMHFQLMHESLARFSESFASFMYGLNMNAFCVDYPEVRHICSQSLSSEYHGTVIDPVCAQAPIAESFRRAKQREEQGTDQAQDNKPAEEQDGETTFMWVSSKNGT